MKKDLAKGDLIKTNPLEGYWVCSLVLNTREKTSDFNAMCHIGITNAVFKHNFDMSEIDLVNLKIIHVSNYENKVVPCIEMYTTKLKKDITLLGKLEPHSYYKEPLEFEIGNGSDGGWPMCGPLNKTIGFQSVHQWRSFNDNEAWLQDIALAEKSHKEMLVRLKNEK